MHKIKWFLSYIHTCYAYARAAGLSHPGTLIWLVKLIFEKRLRPSYPGDWRSRR
jgi:hypothetical protein